MIVGFTDTREGMTDRQKTTLIKFLSMNKVIQFHHGDCIGSDAEAHDIVSKFLIPIIIHPPIISEKRAFKQANFILPAKAYLERNKDIVLCSEILLATPKTSTEQVRSGTWSTIRYARKNGIKVNILLP